MKFLFGDIVVINNNEIGVIVKAWNNGYNYYNYDVYNRMNRKIEAYQEKDIERYKVRHKYLDEEELEYQNAK